MSIRRGKFPNGNLMICKTYTALINIQDLEPIKKEIEILTLISNRATENNCFIKFYGESRQDNCVSLFMEGFPLNLMDLITLWKTKKYNPGRAFFEK